MAGWSGQDLFCQSLGTCYAWQVWECVLAAQRALSGRKPLCGWRYGFQGSSQRTIQYLCQAPINEIIGRSLLIPGPLPLPLHCIAGVAPAQAHRRCPSPPRGSEELRKCQRTQCVCKQVNLAGLFVGCNLPSSTVTGGIHSAPPITLAASQVPPPPPTPLHRR